MGSIGTVFFLMLFKLDIKHIFQTKMNPGVTLFQLTFLLNRKHKQWRVNMDALLLKIGNSCKQLIAWLMFSSHFKTYIIFLDLDISAFKNKSISEQF